MSIDPKLLMAEPVSESHSTWTTKMNGATKGIEYIYRVKDGNYRAQNVWEVALQVPQASRISQGIVVRFADNGCPPRKAVKKNAIWRKSMVFMPTTKGIHLDHFYGKIFEADRTSKHIAKRGERGEMFEALQTSYFRSKMRLKGTVAESDGHDLEHQVLLAKPHDHQRMIRAFFALRVWPLL
jgi:hypothetical protein